jgi:hypothetical protein
MDIRGLETLSAKALPSILRDYPLTAGKRQLHSPFTGDVGINSSFKSINTGMIYRRGVVGELINDCYREVALQD